jgi:hypothetical protein
MHSAEAALPDLAVHQVLRKEKCTKGSQSINRYLINQLIKCRIGTENPIVANLQFRNVVIYV